jgi:hypothetical protein
MQYLSRWKSSGPETKETLYGWYLTLTCDLHVRRRNTWFVHDTPSSGHTYLCKIWMQYLLRLKWSGPKKKNLFRWCLTLTCDLHVRYRNTGFVHDTLSSGHTYSCKIWLQYLSRWNSSGPETGKKLYRWCLALTCDLHVRRRNTGFVHDTSSSGHTYSCKIWMQYLSRWKSSGPETKKSLYWWCLTLTCDLHVRHRNTGFVHDTSSSGHTYLCKIWMQYLSRLKSSGLETKKWDGRTHGRTHARTDRLKPLYPPYTTFRGA